MARPLPHRTPAPTLAPKASDRLMSAYVLAGVILLIGIPAAVAIGFAAVDFSEPTRTGRAAPDWVNSETVRATTSDGESVKARVSIDVGDRETRAVLEANRTQVALLLQISLGARHRQAIQGADGMQRLSQDMESRLNEFLASYRADPVREVVVQELVFNKL